MSFQIMTETKTFPTFSTVIWFYIIVNSQVILEMIFGNKFLTTRTLQLFNWSGFHLTRVDSQMFPVVILSNFYLANLAVDDWSFTGVDIHVAFHVTGSHHFTTHRTRGSRHLLHVSPTVLLGKTISTLLKTRHRWY